MSGSLKIRLAIALGLVIVATVAYGRLVYVMTRPPSVAENVRIIDGDRLELDGARIHLYGIDAPELDQLCGTEEQPYTCGQMAKAALESLFLGIDNIDCELKDEDPEGWTPAICKVNGLDVNAEMVRSGQALAYRDEGFAYSDEESEAQLSGLGLWSDEFQPPWEWRAAQ